VTGGDRVASLVTSARMVLTSGTRLPERERAVARERGRVRLTGGAGLAATEGRGVRARGRWAAWAARGGEEARARGRERRIGPETAQPRGEFSFFFFLFLFLISISISFISFFF
jgi:hypothetical protein